MFQFPVFRLIASTSFLIVCSSACPLALSQSIPQVTGWTLSRSYGKCVSNFTSTTAISQSEGAESFEVVNGLPVSTLGPDGDFAIQDLNRPFSIDVESSAAEETIKSQRLNYFLLSDWGYTVFSN